jgi:hypothetical protein
MQHLAGPDALRRFYGGHEHLAIRFMLERVKGIEPSS